MIPPSLCREPAISIVSVSLDGVLGSSVSVTCTAQLMAVEEATAIIITPYSETDTL